MWMHWDLHLNKPTYTHPPNYDITENTPLILLSPYSYSQVFALAYLQLYISGGGFLGKLIEGISHNLPAGLASFLINIIRKSWVLHKPVEKNENLIFYYIALKLTCDI